MKTEIELLANLLDYPSKDSQQLVTKAHEIIKKSAKLALDEKRSLYDFVSQYAYTDLGSWQKIYTTVFLQRHGVSLYLYEHIYPTTDLRMKAIENLISTYAKHDLEITSDELPDFLPMFLEFVSSLDEEYEALAYLADIAPVIRQISDNLRNLDGGYGLILSVLLSLAARGTAHPSFQLASA